MPGSNPSGSRRSRSESNRRGPRLGVESGGAVAHEGEGECARREAEDEAARDDALHDCVADRANVTEMSRAQDWPRRAATIGG